MYDHRFLDEFELHSTLRGVRFILQRLSVRHVSVVLPPFRNTVLDSGRFGNHSINNVVLVVQRRNILLTGRGQSRVSDGNDMVLQISHLIDTDSQRSPATISDNHTLCLWTLGGARWFRHRSLIFITHFSIDRFPTTAPTALTRTLATIAMWSRHICWVHVSVTSE